MGAEVALGRIPGRPGLARSVSGDRSGDFQDEIRAFMAFELGGGSRSCFSQPHSPPTPDNK